MNTTIKSEPTEAEKARQELERRERNREKVEEFIQSSLDLDGDIVKDVRAKFKQEFKDYDLKELEDFLESALDSKAATQKGIEDEGLFEKVGDFFSGEDDEERLKANRELVYALREKIKDLKIEKNHRNTLRELKTSTYNQNLFRNKLEEKVTMITERQKMVDEYLEMAEKRLTVLQDRDKEEGMWESTREFFTADDIDEKAIEAQQVLIKSLKEQKQRLNNMQVVMHDTLGKGLDDIVTGLANGTLTQEQKRVKLDALSNSFASTLRNFDREFGFDGSIGDIQEYNRAMDLLEDERYSVGNAKKYWGYAGNAVSVAASFTAIGMAYRLAQAGRLGLALASSEKATKIVAVGAGTVTKSGTDSILSAGFTNQTLGAALNENFFTTKVLGNAFESFIGAGMISAAMKPLLIKNASGSVMLGQSGVAVSGLGLQFTKYGGYMTLADVGKQFDAAGDYSYDGAMQAWDNIGGVEGLINKTAFNTMALGLGFAGGRLFSGSPHSVVSQIGRETSADLGVAVTLTELEEEMNGKEFTGAEYTDRLAQTFIEAVIGSRVGAMTKGMGNNEANPNEANNPANSATTDNGSANRTVDVETSPDGLVSGLTNVMGQRMNQWADGLRNRQSNQANRSQEQDLSGMNSKAQREAYNKDFKSQFDPMNSTQTKIDASASSLIDPNSPQGLRFPALEAHVADINRMRANIEIVSESLRNKKQVSPTLGQETLDSATTFLKTSRFPSYDAIETRRQAMLDLYPKDGLNGADLKLVEDIHDGINQAAGILKNRWSNPDFYNDSANSKLTDNDKFGSRNMQGLPAGFDQKWNVIHNTDNPSIQTLLRPELAIRLQGKPEGSGIQDIDIVSSYLESRRHFKAIEDNQGFELVVPRKRDDGRGPAKEPHYKRTDLKDTGGGKMRVSENTRGASGQIVEALDMQFVKWLENNPSARNNPEIVKALDNEAALLEGTANTNRAAGDIDATMSQSLTLPREIDGLISPARTQIALDARRAEMERRAEPMLDPNKKPRHILGIRSENPSVKEINDAYKLKADEWESKGPEMTFEMQKRQEVMTRIELSREKLVREKLTDTDFSDSSILGANRSSSVEAIEASFRDTVNRYDLSPESSGSYSDSVNVLRQEKYELLQSHKRQLLIDRMENDGAETSPQPVNDKDSGGNDSSSSPQNQGGGLNIRPRS